VAMSSAIADGSSVVALRAAGKVHHPLRIPPG
jgi:hypothetical protein